MTLDKFIVSSLKRRDLLFTQIFDFNNIPSKYIHSSFLTAIPSLSDVWNNVKGVTRIQKRISKILLAHFNLKDKFFYDFQDLRTRLGLVDSENLNKLILFAGAVIYADKIKKIVLKKQLDEMRTSIGEEALFFATKRASLITPLIPKITPKEKISVPMREDLEEVGRLCLERCLAGEDGALLERLKLKFPATITWNFNTKPLEEEKTKSWNFLYRILVKEIAPKWKNCFT